MNLYGIPTLLNKVAAVVNPLALVYYDVQGIIGRFLPPQWGIFKEGNPVIIVDSVLDISYRKHARISTYPQQKGVFESYNKVQTPHQIKIRMTKGGSDSERQEFINSLEELQQTIDLFDIVTPERIYTDVNITGMTFNRNARNGVSLISVDIIAEEIITTVKVGFSKPKSATSNDPVNVGTIQAVDSTAGSKPSIDVLHYKFE
jgi:hypothetical protein